MKIINIFNKVGKIIPAKVRWVLTVPALWSEEHKLFMRKAAVEAKLIDHVNSPNLLLSLEVDLKQRLFDYKNN